MLTKKLFSPLQEKAQQQSLFGLFGKESGTTNSFHRKGHLASEHTWNRNISYPKVLARNKGNTQSTELKGSRKRNSIKS